MLPGATCGPNVAVCKRVTDDGAGDPNLVLAFADQIRPAGAAEWITLDFWCPQHTDPTPAPAASDIRDRAIRLLPTIPVHTTGPNTLVNIQTLFWAGTAADRDLGTVTVVGQPVRLRARVAYVDWDFGDGHTDRSDGPGKPYDREHDRCNTVMCPDYFGHVYRQTGQMTISVRITWDASYSLDGGATYNPVGTTPIAGPTSTAQVLVRQARAQLVSDS